MSTQYSLLHDHLVHIQLVEGSRVQCTLPEILDRLYRQDILSFEALQLHQQQAWFSFLVQLAAIAIARGDGHTPDNAQEWKDLLLRLSDENESAWALVEDDVTQPAFMQSPIPKGDIEKAGYKNDYLTPDEMDMLVTSANHDIKRRRISYPNLQFWLFSLVTLQTLQGGLGPGNYGIIRMNGYHGNRPLVGLTPGLSWGDRFRRDLGVLLDVRDSFADQYDLRGFALLWMIPWSGEKTDTIPLRKCDPYFIEICRRIRFTGKGDSLRCWRTTTKSQRISAPDDLNGRTGDPWTPVEKKNMKSLTLGESGFTYDLLHQLLMGYEYTIPATLEFKQSERSGAYLLAQTIARGQGKTYGFHKRIVYVPSHITDRFLSKPSLKEIVAKRSKSRVQKAGEVQTKLLKPAIVKLLINGNEVKQLNWNQMKPKFQPWLDGFQRAIDGQFFDALWASVEMDEDSAKQEWEHLLFHEAESQFHMAEGATPISAIHRWKAISRARSQFYGMAKRVLPRAMENVPVKQPADEEEITQ